MKKFYINNQQLIGILFMILGMFCLSVNDVNVKWLNQKFPVWEVIFFRAFSGMIISILLVLKFERVPTVPSLWLAVFPILKT